MSSPNISVMTGDGTLHEFPRPITEPPDNGTLYWYVDLTEMSIHEIEWINDSVDNEYLTNRLIQATKEGAALQLIAIRSVLQS